MGSSKAPCIFLTAAVGFASMIDALQVHATREEPSVDEMSKIAAENHLHSYLLSKDGVVVVEKYWDSGVTDEYLRHEYKGGSNRELHFMLSVSKTMTGLTIARAAQMGYISMQSPILAYLKVDKTNLAPGTDRITVEDCMNMQSGIVLSNSDVSKQGPEAILSGTSAVNPGHTYNYQEADPQLLWHVVDAVCPGGALTFLEQNVFGPLGIREFEWKTDETGVPTGGSGLSFKPRDMLSVGQMMVDGGKVNGQQFVPKSYVGVAMSPSVSGEDYRSLWHHHAKAFSYSCGGGGQYICISPEKKLVMVMTAGDNDLMNPLLSKCADALSDS